MPFISLRSKSCALIAEGEYYSQSEALEVWVKNPKINFQSADFDGWDIRGVDFSGRSLRGARFNRTTLNYCKFDGCSLNGTEWEYCYVGSCHFRRTTFEAASFTSVRFDICSFNGSDLSGIYLEGCRLYTCYFEKSDIHSAGFSSSHFSQCHWDDARGDHNIRLETYLGSLHRTHGGEYVFYAWTAQQLSEAEEGKSAQSRPVVWIKAGCQNQTIEDYRDHIKEDYLSQAKADCTNAILDFFEGKAKIERREED